jgi:hypothetical protein
LRIAAISGRWAPRGRGLCPSDLFVDTTVGLAIHAALIMLRE